ncbi:WhiB family transcriptional regulator [Mycobacterium hubeiense]|uniref:WhiB family transcriptional regulator n=1 Tax=Mycobacterium hubeiense TaxID=1867256 RepID=UPI000C7F2AE0|nr:WhiB family transcriptional regulator [Mycobacterium sp. QGD 101]
MRARRAPRPDEWEWRLRARCRGLPTEIFFASEAEKGRRKAAREELAKRICRDCLVRPECLAYAVRSGEAYGIWGETTPRERNRIRS